MDYILARGVLKRFAWNCEPVERPNYDRKLPPTLLAELPFAKARVEATRLQDHGSRWRANVTLYGNNAGQEFIRDTDVLSHVHALGLERSVYVPLGDRRELAIYTVYNATTTRHRKYGWWLVVSGSDWPKEQFPRARRVECLRMERVQNPAVFDSAVAMLRGEMAWGCWLDKTVEVLGDATFERDVGSFM